MLVRVNSFELKMKTHTHHTRAQIRFTDVLYVLAFEKFGSSLGISAKGLKVESRINNRTLMLDNDHNPKNNLVLGKLTEFQVDNMTIDELREELRQRG